MNRIYKLNCIFLLLCSNSLFGITLVYNLRVRRIFNVAPILERLKSPKFLVSAVPIVFTRKSNIVDPTILINTREKRIAGGSLFNLRCLFTKNWFAEFTTGLETDHVRFTGTPAFCGSRTGFDDVVIEAGYRHFFGKKIQTALYGLVGLPTRKQVTLVDRFGPLVGSRFNNIGVGAEGSYNFIGELKQSLSAILQTRFIHGFNRKWFPILPRNATIQPGNFSDILFLLQYRYRRTIFETGYDATIFSQQGTNLPIQEIRIPTFVRHSWFANIKHGIFKAFFGKPFIFGAGLNVSKTKRFDARTFSAWIFATTVF